MSSRLVQVGSMSVFVPGKAMSASRRGTPQDLTGRVQVRFDTRW